MVIDKKGYDIGRVRMEIRKNSHEKVKGEPGMHISRRGLSVFWVMVVFFNSEI